MSVLFNEKIKDYFERNTSLTIVDENGDLEIEGTIEDFSLSNYKWFINVNSW